MESINIIISLLLSFFLALLISSSVIPGQVTAPFDILGQVTAQLYITLGQVTAQFNINTGAWGSRSHQDTIPFTNAAIINTVIRLGNQFPSTIITFLSAILLSTTILPFLINAYSRGGQPIKTSITRLRHKVISGLECSEILDITTSLLRAFAGFLGYFIEDVAGIVEKTFTAIKSSLPSLLSLSLEGARCLPELVRSAMWYRGYVAERIVNAALDYIELRIANSNESTAQHQLTRRTWAQDDLIESLRHQIASRETELESLRCANSDLRSENTELYREVLWGAKRVRAAPVDEVATLREMLRRSQAEEKALCERLALAQEKEKELQQKLELNEAEMASAQRRHVRQHEAASQQLLQLIAESGRARTGKSAEEGAVGPANPAHTAPEPTPKNESRTEVQKPLPQELKMSGLPRRLIRRRRGPSSPTPADPLPTNSSSPAPSSPLRLAAAASLSPSQQAASSTPPHLEQVCGALAGLGFDTPASSAARAAEETAVGESVSMEIDTPQQLPAVAGAAASSASAPESGARAVLAQDVELSMTEAPVAVTNVADAAASSGLPEAVPARDVEVSMLDTSETEMSPAVGSVPPTTPNCGARAEASEDVSMIMDTPETAQTVDAAPAQLMAGEVDVDARALGPDNAPRPMAIDEEEQVALSQSHDSLFSGPSLPPYSPHDGARDEAHDSDEPEQSDSSDHTASGDDSFTRMLTAAFLEESDDSEGSAGVAENAGDEEAVDDLSTEEDVELRGAEQDGVKEEDEDEAEFVPSQAEPASPSTALDPDTLSGTREAYSAEQSAPRKSSPPSAPPRVPSPRARAYVPTSANTPQSLGFAPANPFRPSYLGTTAQAASGLGTNAKSTEQRSASSSEEDSSEEDHSSGVAPLAPGRRPIKPARSQMQRLGLSSAEVAEEREHHDVVARLTPAPRKIVKPKSYKNKLGLTAEQVEEEKEALDKRARGMKGIWEAAEWSRLATQREMKEKEDREESEKKWAAGVKGKE